MKGEREGGRARGGRGRGGGERGEKGGRKVKKEKKGERW